LIGIDIVQISRIEKNLNSPIKHKFLSKFLSKKEIDLTKQNPSSIAGFFAAKEAVSKALGCGIGKKLSFMDIKLSKNKKNKPSFKLSKKAQKIFCLNETSLSISHDGGFAIAVAVIL